MTDLSRQLNDDEHTRSNITRAMRLFHASGIADEAAFVQRLYEARSITRSQGGIKKPASIGGGLINRMPYFFGVLEDVLGFKTGAARRLVPQGGGLHHA